MEIIKKSNESTAKTWGEQKPAQKEYRLIKYHLLEAAEEGTVLCNNVTGEVVLLSAEEAAVLDTLPAAYCEVMQQLVEHRFLVPVDYDEHDEVCKLRRILNLFQKKKGIVGYTILPTTGCNARCFYCFEAGAEVTSMSEQTAENVVRFIDTHCGSKRKVKLHWFGGEPTLGAKRISQICHGLQKLDITYTSTMISNGYLLQNEMADEAKELWHLEKVQITLDGMEETYNRVKAYVNIKGSAFEQVLSNIGGLLARDITVNVRMNLDRYNEAELKQLIPMLAQRFESSAKLGMYVWPVFETEACGAMPDHGDYQWFTEKLIEFDQLAREYRKLATPIYNVPELRLNCCMADSEGAVVINPKGELVRCLEHFSSDMAIGNVVDGVTDQERVRQWSVVSETPECADCPFFPRCVRLKSCSGEAICYEVGRNEELRRHVIEAVSVWRNKKM